MQAQQAGEAAPIVAALQELVAPDGAKLELVGLDEQRRALSLRLDLEGVDCIECVMSRGYLEQLSLNLIRKTRPQFERVTIDDPRER